MNKKKIAVLFRKQGSRILLLVSLFANLNLISCGADESETDDEIKQLTAEEQKDLVRFVEYVFFSTAPYVDKSWVETDVPEDELAEQFIDFATETAAIQQVYTEVYNAAKAGDTRAVLAHFSSHGFEFRSGVFKTYYSKVRMKSSWLEKGGGGLGLSPILSEFYIRPASVHAPYLEASANRPGIYIYLTKQVNKWSIHQLSIHAPPPSKYFSDLQYKAP